MKIVFFTDCMSIGPETLDESRRYPALIDEQLEKHDIEVKADSGATTADSLQVLERIMSLKPDVIVYGYGINDALPRGLYRHQRAFIIKSMFKMKLSQPIRFFLRRFFLNPLEYTIQLFFKPKHYVNRKDTRNNLKYVIETVNQNNIPIIVINLAPVKNYRFRNAEYYIIDYNKVIEGVCQEYDIDVINIFSAFQNGHGAILAEDDFHYGVDGHIIAAKEILKVIKNISD